MTDRLLSVESPEGRSQSSQKTSVLAADQPQSLSNIRSTGDAVRRAALRFLFRRPRPKDQPRSITVSSRDILRPRYSDP